LLTILLLCDVNKPFAWMLISVIYVLYFATSAAQQYSNYHTHRLKHKATITIHKDKDTQYKKKKEKKNLRTRVSCHDV